MLGQLAVLIPWIYLKFIYRLSRMEKSGLCDRRCISSGERKDLEIWFVIRHFHHRGQGVLALYSGLSASLLRQLTYSTTRFAIYNVAKQTVAPNGEKIPFLPDLEYTRPTKTACTRGKKSNARAQSVSGSPVLKQGARVKPPRSRALSTAGQQLLTRWYSKKSQDQNE